MLIFIATGISAAIFSLSPFQLAAQEKTMNRFPFLSYYERIIFIALSNFIESMLIFFPMGFALQYFNNSRQTYLAILFLTLLISFPLEYSQQWIVGRYPDITDVLGALVGALAGAMVCHSGWGGIQAICRKYWTGLIGGRI